MQASTVHASAIAQCKASIEAAQINLPRGFQVASGQQPLRTIAPVRPMTQRQREILTRLFYQVEEYGSHIQHVAKAVKLSGVGGFTDAELNGVTNAAAQLLGLIQQRFDADGALLLRDKKLPEKLRPRRAA
ncbi:hypothetical protein [Chitinilyticum aquatile]|uniref:hypothetical protein n=1 Tax=Chitinilyticum aquatile TaxID=362520 RepID=UPI0004167108|nr:hypothetical protein [Chitinilyticum aquatile]